MLELAVCGLVLGLGVLRCRVRVRLELGVLGFRIRVRHFVV